MFDLAQNKRSTCKWPWSISTQQKNCIETFKDDLEIFFGTFVENYEIFFEDFEDDFEISA
jgi:hypothetical protein